MKVRKNCFWVSNINLTIDNGITAKFDIPQNDVFHNQMEDIFKNEINSSETKYVIGKTEYDENVDDVIGKKSTINAILWVEEGSDTVQAHRFTINDVYLEYGDYVGSYKLKVLYKRKVLFQQTDEDKLDV